MTTFTTLPELVQDLAMHTFTALHTAFAMRQSNTLAVLGRGSSGARCCTPTRDRVSQKNRDPGPGRARTGQLCGALPRETIRFPNPA